MKRRRYRRSDKSQPSETPNGSDWSIPSLDDERPAPRSRGGEAMYAPLPDERGGYAPPTGGSRGPMILVLAIGVLLVFGVVVYNAYRQGVRQGGDGSALPQIASEGAFKSTPADPGGRASENVDKQVLGQVEGRARNDEDITPAIVREEPVPMGIETVAANEDQVAGGLASKPPRDPFDDPFAASDQARRQPQSRPQPQPTGTDPVDLQGRLQAAARAQEGGSDIPDAPRQVASVSKTPAPKPSSTFQARPTPAPTLAPATPVKTAPPTSGGIYVVQLASVRSSEAAEVEWAKASSRAPSLVPKAQKNITTVDLGDKGVWHRVRAGSFDSRAAAAAFCDAYKAAGGDCFVTAR